MYPTSPAETIAKFDRRRTPVAGEADEAPDAADERFLDHIENVDRFGGAVGLVMEMGFTRMAKVPGIQLQGCVLF
jgi:hypothetical protein